MKPLVEVFYWIDSASGHYAKGNAKGIYSVTDLSAGGYITNTSSPPLELKQNDLFQVAEEE